VAPIGVGLIGTGTIAQRHLDALANYPGGRAVAVFDVLPDRARATAERWTSSWPARRAATAARPRRARRTS